VKNLDPTAEIVGIAEIFRAKIKRANSQDAAVVAIAEDSSEK